MIRMFRVISPIRIISIILIFAFFFSSFPIPIPQAEAVSWYNASWVYRKKLSINYKKVPSTQTNFPVLVSFTSDSDLAARALSTGYDILFTSSNGTTKIPYERESYTSATGALVAWVQVPSVSSTVNTAIYMYYGNAAASDQQQATSVWDANYKGVWHMANSTTTAWATVDSTTNALNGTFGGPNSAGGPSGAFDGTAGTYVSTPDSADWDYGTSDFTIDTWVKFTTTPTNVMITGQYQDANNYTILEFDAGYMEFLFYTGGTARYNGHASFTPTLGVWYHIAFVRNGSTPLMFVNGVSKTVTDNTAFNGNLSGLSGSMMVGTGEQNGNFFTLNGNLDEFRISNTARWTSAFTPPVAEYASDANTVLLLHMDGANNSTTFTDSSGSPHTMTANGNAKIYAPSAVTGKIDGGGNFDGSTDYIDLGTYTSPNALTISAIINNSSANAGQSILSASDSGATDVNMLSDDASANIIYYSVMNPPSPYNGVRWKASYTFTQGTPYFITLTQATPSTAPIIYVNGVSQTVSVDHTWGAGTPIRDSLPLSIGRQGALASNYFNGVTDEVRLSNSVRSADWITTEYNNQSSPNTFITRAGQEPPAQTAPTSKVASRAWYTNPSQGTWTYRMPITINHANVSGTVEKSLANFPVLVSVTNANLKSTGNGGYVSSTSGYDILFTNSDGSTKLSHEIESYDAVNGILVAWVKVPTVSSLADNTIFIYYGNANAPNQQNATGVWDNNYKGVWHMGETSGSRSDSTTNINTLTDNNTVTSNPGKIVTAGQFVAANSEYLSETDNTSLRTGDIDFTISAWVYADTLPSSGNAYHIVSKYGGATGEYLLRLNNASGTINFQFYPGDNAHVDASTFGVPSTGTWYFVAGSYNSATKIASISVNGGTPNNSSAVANSAASTGTFLLGARMTGPQQFFDGRIDEVHLEKVLRTVDWVTTEYNNQNAPGTFETFGTQQTLPTLATISGWYNASWGYRKQIIINHKKVSTVSSTSLTNFPVLFNQTDTNLKTVANGGKVGRTDGLDMVFTSGDGLTKLNYEMESYAPTTGATVAWVQVPNLSPYTDTTLYLYFGNAASSDQSNKTAVWDSNYKGVWHLADNAANTAVVESTSNNHTGTAQQNTSALTTTGKVNGALTFLSDSDYITIADSADFDLAAGNFTIDAWVTVPASREVYATVLSNYLAAGSGWIAYVYSNGKTSFLYNNDVVGQGDVLTWNTGTWYHLVWERDGNTLRFFRNGATAGTADITGVTITDAAYPEVGRAYGSLGNTEWKNPIDELRISKGIARSADWIKTEYNNQNSPSTFYFVGGLSSLTQQTAIAKVAPRTGTAASWYSTSWSYRKKLSISYKKVPSAQTNFPTLVNFTTDAELSAKAQSNGNDILFTNADGTTKIPYERELYTNTTGSLTAWVNVPYLSSTSTTNIYMYYGNAGATDQQQATSVWDANYKGVWHLADNLATTAVVDSTNQLNGTNAANTNTKTTTGKVDGALTFNGSSDYVNFGTYTFPNAITANVWYNPTTNPADVYPFYADTGADHGNGIYILNGAQLWWVAFKDGSNYGRWRCYYTFSPGTAYHIVVTQVNPSSDPVMYINGISQTVSNYDGAIVGTPARIGVPLSIGRRGGISTGYANGVLDEIRLSNSVRSADWIKTEYNNQSSPNTFVTRAGQELRTGSAGANVKFR